jgi:hypothetical protein
VDQLIQQSYDPISSHRLSPDDQRRLQGELFELQRRWEAWGLVVPFLFEYTDPNVQFFGAHTAQVKISRDWCATLPPSLRVSDFFRQGELSCRPLRRTHSFLAWHYGALDRPAPKQGHPSEIVRCRASSSPSIFFPPSFPHLPPSVAIRACPSPRASRPSPLARLDYRDCYRALQRGRVHRKYFRLL